MCIRHTAPLAGRRRSNESKISGGMPRSAARVRRYTAAGDEDLDEVGRRREPHERRHGGRDRDLGNDGERGRRSGCPRVSATANAPLNTSSARTIATRRSALVEGERERQRECDGAHQSDRVCGDERALAAENPQRAGEDGHEEADRERHALDPQHRDRGLELLAREEEDRRPGADRDAEGAPGAEDDAHLEQALLRVDEPLTIRTPRAREDRERCPTSRDGTATSVSMMRNDALNQPVTWALATTATISTETR